MYIYTHEYIPVPNKGARQDVRLQRVRDETESGTAEYLLIYANYTFTATHCSTLQHTATHCNTLQHTTTSRESGTARETVDTFNCVSLCEFV